MCCSEGLIQYGLQSIAKRIDPSYLNMTEGLSLQVFYFMQPDTTPLKLARDITAEMSEQRQGTLPSNEQSQNDNRQEAEHAQAQAIEDISPITDVSENQIQVVPLYTPEGSAIKFFCVHPSHRYALSLMPIAAGFQGQVNHTVSKLMQIFCSFFFRSDGDFVNHKPKH